MASKGKKKPERKTLGKMVNRTVRNASCCVLAIVEASKPMPRLESRSTHNKFFFIYEDGLLNGHHLTHHRHSCHSPTNQEHEMQL